MNQAARIFRSLPFMRPKAPAAPAVPETFTLDDFAPVATRHDFTSGLSHFAAVTQLPIMDIATRHADALDDVWQALADDLNIDRPRRVDAFTPGDLKEIFLHHSQTLNMVQMQLPAIVPADGGHDLESFIHNQKHIHTARMFGPFGDETTMVGDILNQFHNLSMARKSLRGKELIGVPVAAIDGWVLRALADNGQMPALKALQRCIGRACHDYYHQLLPVNDTVYFDTGLLHRGSFAPAWRETFYDADTPLYQNWDKALYKALRVLESDFGKNDTFEPHALLTHVRVFDRQWQSQDFRAGMLADIDCFMDGIAAVEPAMHKEGYERFAFGALTIMGAYLLRAAPPEHELMEYFEDQVSARFSIKGAHAFGMLGEYVAEDDLLEMDDAGEVVMWNVQRVAEETYGLIYSRELQALQGRSRKRAQHELNRVRHSVAASPHPKVV